MAESDQATAKLIAESEQRLTDRIGTTERRFTDLMNERFDAVTSVFLFHELPADARRRVMREAFRVLVPGGRFVVCDSAQLSDSRELEEVLHTFPATYHEPYYKGYLRDDLAEVMTECGFELESSTPHPVSKVVVCRKPLRTKARRSRPRRKKP